MTLYNDSPRRDLTVGGAYDNVGDDGDAHFGVDDDGVGIEGYHHSDHK